MTFTVFRLDSDKPKYSLQHRIYSSSKVKVGRSSQSAVGGSEKGNTGEATEHYSEIGSNTPKIRKQSIT